MDERRRSVDGIKGTVGELATAETLLDVPVRPFPAELEVERTVSPQCLVSSDGNLYSVPPGLASAQVRVLHRLDENHLDIATAARPEVRRVDFDWMMRLGWIRLPQSIEIRFGTSRAGSVDVALYTTAFVDAIPAEHPEVDWERSPTVQSSESAPATSNNGRRPGVTSRGTVASPGSWHTSVVIAMV